MVNSGGDSVTELKAADGTLVRLLNGPGYGFDHPSAIAADGTHVWVTNEPYTGSVFVTELTSGTGAVVRVLSGARYEFS